MLHPATQSALRTVRLSEHLEANAGAVDTYSAGDLTPNLVRDRFRVRGYDTLFSIPAKLRSTNSTGVKIAERAVRPFGVVFNSPVFDDASRVRHAPEPVLVQTLVGGTCR